MKRFLLLVILISACAVPTKAPATASEISGFEYMPLPNGQSITYWFASMTGYYHPDTHMLDGWTATYITDMVITNSRIDASMPYFLGNQQLYNAIQLKDGALFNLYSGPAVTGKGITYWGEYGGAGGACVFPAEAYITKNPIAGEVIDVSSRIYYGCDTMRPSLYTDKYHWRYQTTWVSGDMVRTDLAEYNHELDPAAKDTVYTYFFQKDVGIVQILWGSWDHATNRVTGYWMGKK